MLGTWTGRSSRSSRREAILLAIAIGLVLARGRELEAIRELTAEDGAGDELDTRVRHLQERLTASEFELDQQTRNVVLSRRPHGRRHPAS